MNKLKRYHVEEDWEYEHKNGHWCRAVEVDVLELENKELEKDLDDMIGEHNDLKQDAYDARKSCRIMEMETGLHRERADKAVQESVEHTERITELENELTRVETERDEARVENSELKEQIAQMNSDPRGFFN